MNLASSIIATLAYHDIFDYPLKLPEIHEFLIGKHVSSKDTEFALTSLIKAKKVQQRSGFYYLKGRSKIYALRKSREKHSRGKLKIAALYGKFLRSIPTIRLLAVSGALAMENSHTKDDIDFVIITAKNSLWTTRFLANILLLPVKRTPSSKTVSNRACLNLFLDETGLRINNHNIYQAHELCQMKIIWDKGKTYSKLIKSNQWVTKFLPNWQPDFSQEIVKKPVNFRNPKKIESFLKSVQLSYMRKRVTTEKIGDRQLFFHPKDTENFVLGEYRKRLSRLKISLKS